MRNNQDKIAVVDIGSNSVRLFVFQIEGRNISQIAAEKFFCGLGRDLGTTGKLNPESVRRTFEALQSFREELKKHDIKSEIVIGTAALREAQDAANFLSDVKTRTGFDIRIINGEEEARLAALGVLYHNPQASGIVADFGGGSLELAKIEDGTSHEKISLKLGAHYLKAMQDEDAVDSILDKALAKFPVFKKPETVYLIGGSWRSLAKAYLGHDYVEGVKLDCEKMIDFCLMLEKMKPTDVMINYLMEIQRAEIMDVSALMLRKLIENLSPQAIEVSIAGIRDGIAYDYMINQRGDL